jgi:hypothetical protein
MMVRPSPDIPARDRHAACACTVAFE